jgi:hypothetical protein
MEIVDGADDWMREIGAPAFTMHVQMCGGLEDDGAFAMKIVEHGQSLLPSPAYVMSRVVCISDIALTFFMPSSTSSTTLTLVLQPRVFTTRTSARLQDVDTRSVDATY